MSESLSENRMPDIPDDVRKAFEQIIKIGIYRELFERKLLSAEQLNALIHMTGRMS